jgi:uncharacterized protein (TIGR02466 family)
VLLALLEFCWLDCHQALIVMEKRVSYIFPTPIGQFRLGTNSTEVNGELRRIILDREQSEASQNHANAGGWHSRRDLLEWPECAVGVLKGWIREAVDHVVGSAIVMMHGPTAATPDGNNLSIKGWANVSRRGNYHRIVYYVSVGSDAADYPLSGLLELLDPRPFTEMIPTPGDPFGQKLVIKPETGMIVIFPSWMYHFVNPYHGEGERISVAFNVAVV